MAENKVVTLYAKDLVAAPLFDVVIAPTAFEQMQAAGIIIRGSDLKSGAIDTAQLAPGAVTGAVIGDNGILASKLSVGGKSWTHNLVFSSTDLNTVAWASGTITMADGSTYAIDAGNTGNMAAASFIYLDVDVSETVLQVTTTAATAVGDNKILLAFAQNSTAQAIFQVFGGKGGLKIPGTDIETGSITKDQIKANTITANEIAADTITAAQIAANTITASEIAANTITAAKIAAGTITATELAANSVTATQINVATLSAISANMGTITAGSITGVTITGGTIRTDSGTYPKAYMNSSGFFVNGQYMTFNNATGTMKGELFYYASENAMYLTGATGIDTFINGDTLILNGANDYVDLRIGNSTKCQVSTSGIYVTGNITLSGTVDGVDIASHASDASAHHSSTSDGYYITPARICGIGVGGDGSTTITFAGHVAPSSGNSKYSGTATNYWARVYSDAYFTKNTTFQTFDIYDDLQIIRDLEFDKNGKLVTSNLPKEIADEGFINFGGMTSFNLCASRRIVECIDDLQKKVKMLESLLDKKAKMEDNINN